MLKAPYFVLNAPILQGAFLVLELTATLIRTSRIVLEAAVAEFLVSVFGVVGCLGVGCLGVEFFGFHFYRPFMQYCQDTSIAGTIFLLCESPGSNRQR